MSSGGSRLILRGELGLDHVPLATVRNPGVGRLNRVSAPARIDRYRDGNAEGSHPIAECANTPTSISFRGRSPLEEFGTKPFEDIALRGHSIPMTCSGPNTISIPRRSRPSAAPGSLSRTPTSMAPAVRFTIAHMRSTPLSMMRPAFVSRSNKSFTASPGRSDSRSARLGISKLSGPRAWRSSPDSSAQPSFSIEAKRGALIGYEQFSPEAGSRDRSWRRTEHSLAGEKSAVRHASMRRTSAISFSQADPGYAR